MSEKIIKYSLGKILPVKELQKHRYTDGAVLENFGQGFFLYTFTNEMSILENESLQGDIVFKIIEHDDFIQNIVGFGNEQLIFDLNFDPTLGSNSLETKKKNVLESNALNIVGVESTTMVIKALRVLAIPENVLEIWRRVWKNSFNVKDYSLRYNKFVDNLQKYSVCELWDNAKYVDKVTRK